MKVGCGPLKVNGVLHDDRHEMANILAQQYESVFSSPKYNSEEIKQRVHESGANAKFSDLTITEEDICQSIGKISENSAPGPDGIPAILLKRCCNALKLPLRLLWERSLELGEIPTGTKLGVITPVHKGGARNEAKNYRPISLTSHIIKVFERILVNRIVDFLEAEQLLNDNQHGFRRGRSCLSQLLNHYHNLLALMEKNEAVDVIYLDFAKAFDRVDHNS